MERTTVTPLFEPRTLSAKAIAVELARLGDSSTVQDCLLRTALLQILSLETALKAEQQIVDTLQEFGLQTLSSMFGVHSTSQPPGFRRKWICWQGREHANLREAVRQAIEVRDKRGRRR